MVEKVETYRVFRRRLIAEKESSTYDELERRYQCNRWYLSMMIHDGEYKPPAWLLRKNGVVREKRPPRISINLNDPFSAADSIASKEPGEIYMRELAEELMRRAASVTR